MELKKYTDIIKKSIIEILDSYKELPSIGEWTIDSLEKIKNFSINGKLIRGALICLIEDKIKGSYSENSIKTSVAIELLQSGLLIHDDIMDNDDIRRGQTSIHAQYRNKYQNSKNPQKLGESLGICLGDICFFLSFDILSKIPKKEIMKEIITLFSKEMITVGLAQMQDIYFSEVYNIDPQYEDIINLYKYKTARYSFSLPLIAGAYISEIKDEIPTLSILGEKIGILFQIKDDYIDLFSSTEEIGKPVGSDIINEKKTIIFYYLKEELKVKNLSDYTIKEIKEIIEQKGINKKIQKIVDNLLKEINNIIENISNESLKNELKKVSQFVIERKK
ncbi:MAG TPA: polyprenyl synthetase family protein [Spirochaetota bacterium]|nr:polyprenyl synthetase family protein [Spirochaetota bacterium]HOM37903.1 polyprenyl synthetase family protein [Spirochaetota bacterium]HPQ48707.1 polyprenyl synthetase family protein [Spirochaetota bacterium]